MSKTGILLLLGAGLWFMARRTVNNVSVRFERLRFAGFTANGVNLEAVLLIHNPLLADVSVSNIVGDLYVMDRHCAVIDYPINQVLAAKKTNRFSVLLNLNTQQLGQALWDNIQTGDIKTLTVLLDGYVTVGGIRIPVNRQFVISDFV